MLSGSALGAGCDDGVEDDGYSPPEWGGGVLGQHAKYKTLRGHPLSLQPILILKQQINNIDLAK